MTRIQLGLWCGMMAALGLLLAAGCTPPRPSETPPKKSGDAHKDDHPEKGPNGGPLAEWGEEEYHAEFTVDRKKKQATVYILDGEVKDRKPIEAETIKLTLTNEATPVEIVLKADPDKGDPKGKSSRFVGIHDKLGQDVKFKGIILGFKDYRGKFEEK